MTPVAPQRTFGVSLFTLKLIAMAAMAADHIGALFFPDQLAWRCLGRLAFPIYCFLIVNGFFHTHSRSVYLARLVGFAVVSQIPYTLMLLEEHGVPLAMLPRRYDLLLHTLNSLFVLSLGLLTLLLLDKLREKLGSGGHLLGLLCAAGLTALSYWLHCEYAFLGVPLIIAFYEAHLFRQSSRCPCPAAGVLAQLSLGTAALALYVVLRCLLQGILWKPALLYGVCQFAALLLILLYNGTRGHQNKAVQYCFYLFYPAHILLLVLLHTILL